MEQTARSTHQINCKGPHSIYVWINTTSSASSVQICIEIYIGVIGEYSSTYYNDYRVRCYSCASVNASLIIGGAGVDPGVFLSTIKLSTVPVTPRCRDPFDGNDAMKAGGSTPICDDGLCVKINYTDKTTGVVDVLRACLPESDGVFKQNCASFSSSMAFGMWCVCGNELCNTSTIISPNISLNLITTSAFVILSALRRLF